MILRRYKPLTPGRRHRVDAITKVSKKRPEKSLAKILAKKSGRNNMGRVTVRHQGGRQKRLFRQIDFRRDKKDISAKVMAIEYDPNRTANIALLYYQDGEKRYILAPAGLKRGMIVIKAEKAESKIGNSLPLRNISLKVPIHNLELWPGRGGCLIRGAGTAAIIQSKEKDTAMVKLPSGEIRKVSLDCYATIGQVSNVHQKNVKLGKAGRKRLMGIRPSVRGVCMHPSAHPHGGGEGRSGIGMPSPKSPWGKKTLGKKTRKIRKYSNKYIIKRRH